MRAEPYQITLTSAEEWRGTQFRLTLMGIQSWFYRRIDRIARDIPYADHSRLLLDVYLPRTAAMSVPVFVFIHGEPLKTASKNKYAMVGRVLARLRYICVVLNYRSYPEVEGAGFLDDVAAGLSWVQKHIAYYGGNPEQIILGGHSLGGYIATTLALDPRRYNIGNDIVKGLVSLAGIYDLQDYSTLDVPHWQGIMGGYGSFAGHDRPMIHVRPGISFPILIAHGMRDHLVQFENAARFHDALNKAGADVTFVDYYRLGHSDLLLELIRPESDIARRIDVFIKDCSYAA